MVFRTAEGTKLAAALLGRGVAFEVDGYDPDAGEAWSVVIKGTAVEIEKMYEMFDALDLPLFPWHAGPKHRFVRIEPEEITGRRFHVVDHDAWGGDRTNVPPCRSGMIKSVSDADVAAELFQLKSRPVTTLLGVEASAGSSSGDDP